MRRIALFLFLAHPLFLREVHIRGRKLPCWYLTSDPTKVMGVYFREGHREMFKDYATCFDSPRMAILAAAREGYQVSK
jgi:hypothetical protein